MGKQAHPRTLNDSEAKSVIRNLRVSPQKLNLVAALIRGMDVNNAVATLTFSRRRISGDVKKALQSAIANAENNHSLDVDRLYVKEAHVGKGLVMKRFRARAKGRGQRPPLRCQLGVADRNIERGTARRVGGADRAEWWRVEGAEPGNNAVGHR